MLFSRRSNRNIRFTDYFSPEQQNWQQDREDNPEEAKLDDEKKIQDKKNYDTELKEIRWGKNEIRKKKNKKNK
jgi:hypothetical protein